MSYDSEDLKRVLGEGPLEVESPAMAPLKSTYNAGLSGFITLLYRLLKNVMPEVRFQPAWPQGSDVNASLPAITYKVVSRVPIRGIKPRLMEVLEDEEHPGQEVHIYVQDFDVVMEFDLWTDRSYEADGLGCTKDPSACPLAKVASALCRPEFKPELCPYSMDNLLERFENFMLEYAGIFMNEAGVQQLYFLKQLEDAQEEKLNPPAVKRPLQYALRIERTYVLKTAELESVDTMLDIPDQLKEE